jgi:hypothetical protein
MPSTGRPVVRFGYKQTFAIREPCPLYPPESGHLECSSHVCYGPIADIKVLQKHLVTPQALPAFVAGHCIRRREARGSYFGHQYLLTIAGWYQPLAIDLTFLFPFVLIQVRYATRRSDHLC